MYYEKYLFTLDKNLFDLNKRFIYKQFFFKLSATLTLVNCIILGNAFQKMSNFEQYLILILVEIKIKMSRTLIWHKNNAENLFQNCKKKINK